MAESSSSGAGDGKRQGPGGEDGPSPKKLHIKTPTNLPHEVEETMAIWIEAHPELYDRNHEGWRDRPRRQRLWEEQGTVVGYPAGQLQLWFSFIRTRYQRIRQVPVGAPLNARNVGSLTRLSICSDCDCL